MTASVARPAAKYFPVPPNVAGKRLTRAAANCDALSLAFEDGVEVTVEPTRDETGVNASDTFTGGDPVDALPPGVTVRRVRWIDHPDVPAPWGVRFDLDNDQSVYVF